MSHACCTLFTVFSPSKLFPRAVVWMQTNPFLAFSVWSPFEEKTCNADFGLKQKFNHLCQISSVIIYLFILFYPPGTKQSSAGLYWCQNGSEIRRSFSFSLMQNSSCVHSAAKRTKKPSHTRRQALRHTPALAGRSARSPQSDFWPFGGRSPTALIDRLSFTLVLNSASRHRHSRCFRSYVFTVLKIKFAEWSIGRFLQVAANNHHEITSVLRRLEKKTLSGLKVQTVLWILASTSV